ncbi:MAG: hypothetical protein LBR90_03935, partial [Elusimicrobiota bacterium]|nr:hypothetical protein [Elusimicrobiota bacterium]
DFASAYKNSRGGAFEVALDFVLAGARAAALSWQVIEIKDSHGDTRGFLMISESARDLPPSRYGWGKY